MNEINAQENWNLKPVKPDYKLFSGGQIVAGAICFGIAGQIMLAINYAKLKDAESAKRKLLFALVFLPLLLLLLGIGSIVGIYIIFSSYSEFKKHQKTAYNEYQAQKGKRCSHWDVDALCVLSFIAFPIIALTELVIIFLLLDLIFRIYNLIFFVAGNL